MTPSARLAPEAPAGRALLPPRLPTFDEPESDAAASVVTESAQARLDSGRMAACLLVVADSVFFGGLFGVYAIIHASYPEVFAFGRFFLDARVGAVATSVLLVSSFAVALAVQAAQLGRRRLLVASVAATLGLSALFLALQGAELAARFDQGSLPGRYFLPTEQVWETPAFRREHPRAARYAALFRPGVPGVARQNDAAPVSSTAVPVVPPLESLVRVGALGDKAVYATVPSEPRKAHVFFGLYFLFTGLHAAHVIGGTAMWAWLLLRARRGVFGSLRFGSIRPRSSGTWSSSSGSSCSRSSTSFTEGAAS